MKKQPFNFEKIARNVFVIVLLFSFSQNLFGQKNNIKMILIGKSSLTFERAINTKSSIMAGLKWYSGLERKNFRSPGLRFTGEYRIYLSQKNKTLSGFYLAPNFSRGQHEVSYYRAENLGVLLDLFFLTLDLADGEISSYSYFDEPKTLTGTAKVTATGIGVKIGVQKRWKHFTLDMGANISKNSVRGHSGGLLLSDGTRKSFNANLDGLHPELYLGIGFAF